MNTIIVFLSSYLFLADHDKLVETVKKFMPEPVIKVWDDEEERYPDVDRRVFSGAV